MSEPIASIYEQLQNLPIFSKETSSTNLDDGFIEEHPRFEKLSLRGLSLSSATVEPLEEILKRIKFKSIDLECVEFEDADAAIAIIEMMEFYDSTIDLSIGYHSETLVPRVWACLAKLVRQSACLKSIDIKASYMPDATITIWCRAIRGAINIRTLHLEQTSLSGKPFSLLCVALHHNRTVQELFLADNNLNTNDMKSFAFALKLNRVVCLLDLRNNKLGDSGVRELCYALNQQCSAYEQSKKGSNNENGDDENAKDKELLEDSDQIDKISLATSQCSTQENNETGVQTLVLWNNHITGASMPALSQVIRKYKWLVTLNLGQNPKLGDDGVFSLRPGLQRAKLQRLGMYNCGLECEAAVAIAEVIAEARYLIRIDLRKNDIRFSGIMALAHALRENTKLLFLNIDSGKFSIKKNYNKRGQNNNNSKNTNRTPSSDDSDNDDKSSGKESDGAESELADHQLKFAKLIDEYQKRNQEMLKASQEGVEHTGNDDA